MHIDYITAISPAMGISSPNIYYHRKAKTPCCETMALEAGNREDGRVIGLETRPDRHADYPDTGRDASVCLFRTQQWENGEVTTSSIPISHCPFCGAEITLEEVERHEVDEKPVHV